MTYIINWFKELFNDGWIIINKRFLLVVLIGFGLYKLYDYVYMRGVIAAFEYMLEQEKSDTEKPAAYNDGEPGKNPNVEI